MTLLSKIEEDARAALKARDSERVSVLRMLKAKVLETEVAVRSKRGRDAKLDDEEVLEVLVRYAKQIRQSIDAYKQGGREDLVAHEEAQLAVVEDYLPKQKSPEEIRQVVQQVILSVGATSMKDMGQVMRESMARMQGAADGKQVSQLVKEMLAK